MCNTSPGRVSYPRGDQSVGIPTLVNHLFDHVGTRTATCLNSVVERRQGAVSILHESAARKLAAYNSTHLERRQRCELGLLWYCTSGIHQVAAPGKQVSWREGSSHRLVMSVWMHLGAYSFATIDHAYVLLAPVKETLGVRLCIHWPVYRGVHPQVPATRDCWLTANNDHTMCQFPTPWPSPQWIRVPEAKVLTHCFAWCSLRRSSS